MSAFRASAFGLIWDADIALERFAPCLDLTLPANVRVQRVAALATRDPIAEPNKGFVYRDGIRFAWGDEVVFDMFDGSRVDYLPGTGWRGRLPVAFYSTIAALVSAWRGAIPFHGCAVEVDGKALLICGDAGAGKSTLAAAMVSQGAGFIADDLSVVTWNAQTAAFVLQPGRPSMRLSPITTSWLNPTHARLDPDDPQGKFLILPADSPPREALPLAEIWLLGERADLVRNIMRYVVLQHLLFRPRWLAQLPNSEDRSKMVLRLSQAVAVKRLFRQEILDRETFQNWGQSQLARLGNAQTDEQ